MFLPASSTLPLLPPPFTSILSTQYTSSNNLEQSPTGQPAQRRPNTRQPHPSSLRNPNSLYNLQLDEAAISSRKAAISTYGYSWLRPAGVAKTMLGRREEEAEKDEMARQMREQEEMELEMERVEELTRQARLAEQQQQEQGHGQGVQQRNLDDDIPDADAQARTQQEAEAEAEAEADLDDEIPDADADAEADNTFSDEDEDDVEGETGITDEVEHTNLEDGEEQDLSPRPAVATNTTTATTTASTTMAPPSNRRAPNLDARQARALAAQGAHHAHGRRQQQQDLARREQEALANVMLDEDEQGFADRDLDAEIPRENENDEGAEAMEARDLDDDVPDAADEEDEEASGGEWQHTDTELEEDESGILLTEDVGEDVSMDMMSGVGSAVRVGGRRSTSGRFIAAAASGGNNLPATPTADPSSTLQTPVTGEIGGSGSTGRRWLNRTSLFGRGRTGNLFAGFTGSGSGSGSPHAPAHIEPRTEEQQEQQQQQPPQPRRRSARRALGRENQSARESLD